MNRQDMFEREQRLSRTAVERDLAQVPKENRARWAVAGAFEEADVAEVPDRGERYFATVDAYVAGVGAVRAGRFFEVPAGLAARFQPSRTLLPASRAALAALTRLRDELLAAGQTAQAEAVDLRPVRPLGEPPAERREQERAPDTGGES